MYRIPRIKFTELKMVNKLKGSSKDTSIPLGREKKAIIEGREEWRDLGGKKRHEGKRNITRFRSGEQDSSTKDQQK